MTHAMARGVCTRFSLPPCPPRRLPRNAPIRERASELGAAETCRPMHDDVFCMREHHRPPGTTAIHDSRHALLLCLRTCPGAILDCVPDLIRGAVCLHVGRELGGTLVASPFAQRYTARRHENGQGMPKLSIAVKRVNCVASPPQAPDKLQDTARQKR